MSSSFHHLLGPLLKGTKLAKEPESKFFYRLMFNDTTKSTSRTGGNVICKFLDKNVSVGLLGKSLQQKNHFGLLFWCSLKF